MTNQIDLDNSRERGERIAEEVTDAKNLVLAVIFIPLMAAIARAWYEKTGDKMLAAGKALNLSIAWKAWGFACLWWIGNFAMGAVMLKTLASPDQHSALLGTVDSTFQVHGFIYLNLAVLVPAIFVSYNKLVDRSAFNHHWFYRTVQPVRFVINWMPWPVLTSLVLIPAMWYHAVGS
jgi:hypothetical protein